MLVTEVLQKMIKQRRELIDMYVKGGRQELADAEAAEIAVIEGFLPRQMSDDEAERRDRRDRRRDGRRIGQGHGPGDGAAQGAPRRRSTWRKASMMVKAASERTVKAFLRAPVAAIPQLTRGGLVRA